MNNTLPIRNSAKILLINQHNELLLMCADDPNIRNKYGIYNGKFWFTIGGAIESNETVMDAAIRELKEETGLNHWDVKFGPEVWCGEFELLISNKPVRLNQKFIVAHTSKNEITLNHLTQNELTYIKDIAWFSMEKIINCPDIIYPVVLPEYLPNILNKNYPSESILIDLTKQPKNKAINY